MRNKLNWKVNLSFVVEGGFGKMGPSLEKEAFMTAVIKTARSTHYPQIILNSLF
jgi:hypothetical protein